KNKIWLQNKDPQGWADELKFLQSKEWNCLIERDVVKPGLLPYLQSQFNIEVQNNVHYPKPTPLAWKKPPDFTPYNYQSTSFQGLIEARHGHISLPTGSGKSLVL